jgi:enoyl-CoA hydratase
MHNDELLIDWPSPWVARLRLNRPERRNALSTPLLAAIAEALKEAAGDDAIRAVVIGGSATVFAAGADLVELEAAGAADVIKSPRFLAWSTIRNFSKPVVAGVEGWCLGAGLELAMCCDLVVAGDTARFGQPETNLGVMPGAGGTATLARLVGRSRAMRMVLTGEPISAAEALDAGLVADVVSAGEAENASLRLATTIAARAPLALQGAKASIRDAMRLNEDDHLLAERKRFVALLGTEDKAEGLAAFREKRTPVWRGR